MPYHLWQDVHLLVEWANATIPMLYKKGEPTSTGNYCLIALSCCMYQVMCKSLPQHMKTLLTALISSNQAGGAQVPHDRDTSRRTMDVRNASHWRNVCGALEYCQSLPQHRTFSYRRYSTYLGYLSTWSISFGMGRNKPSAISVSMGGHTPTNDNRALKKSASSHPCPAVSSTSSCMQHSVQNYPQDKAITIAKRRLNMFDAECETVQWAICIPLGMAEPFKLDGNTAHGG